MPPDGVIKTVNIVCDFRQGLTARVERDAPRDVALSENRPAMAIQCRP